MKLWEVMRGNVLLCEVMRGYARYLAQYKLSDDQGRLSSQRVFL